MAKTLYLVRHAKSSWSDINVSDFDRPLNKRGLHDAPMMGKRLKHRNVKPDIILCSPAKRTRQTVEFVLQEIGGSIDSVQFDENIYEASTGTLLSLIKALPDACTSAMLIGHNPSMHELAHRLSDVNIGRMPTCAIATIDLAIDRWREIDACTKRLVDFDCPKKTG